MKKLIALILLLAAIPAKAVMEEGIVEVYQEAKEEAQQAKSKIKGFINVRVCYRACNDGVFIPRSTDQYSMTQDLLKTLTDAWLAYRWERTYPCERESPPDYPPNYGFSKEWLNNTHYVDRVMLDRQMRDTFYSKYCDGYQVKAQYR